VVEDFVAEGVVYLELRTTLRRDIMKPEEYLDAVIKGL